jgi:transposase
MCVSYYFLRKFEDLYPNNFYVLRYDSLLQDTEDTVRRLCDFLAIDFHENMLEVTLYDHPIRQMGWSVSQHKDNKVSRAPLTAWQKQMSKLAVRLTTADISDSAGAQMILDGIRKRWPWLKHLFADVAYDRAKLMDKAAFLDFVIEIVRRMDGQEGFEVLPRRWVVERTFG